MSPGHLTATYGVRHLLLLSRGGRAAEGAAALEADLSGLGAEVRTKACDVAHAQALGRVLAAVPDDGTIGDWERLVAQLGTKRSLRLFLGVPAARVLIQSAARPENERLDLLLTLIRAQTAIVLGYEARGR